MNWSRNARLREGTSAAQQQGGQGRQSPGGPSAGAPKFQIFFKNKFYLNTLTSVKFSEIWPMPLSEAQVGISINSLCKTTALSVADEVVGQRRPS